MPTRIVAYHRTEELQDGTFIPQVEIRSASDQAIDTYLRDDGHPCPTIDEAETMEKRLVEIWRLEHFPDLGVGFLN